MNANNLERLEQGSKWLGRFLKYTPLVCLPQKKFKPRSHLKPLKNDRDGYEWLAVDNDPQFIFKRGLLPPGWYMLEVAMTHDRPSVAVKLYFNCGNGFEEEKSVYLPLKSGRVTKRLFWMPFGVKTVRFDPMECEGKFTLWHFRLAWLTPAFAHDRLAQRLANMHYQWRKIPKKEIIQALKHEAKKENKFWRDLALEKYDATFERFTVKRSYAHWLKSRVALAGNEIVSILDDLSYKPLVSILIPVFNPHPEWLRQCLDSILAQHYTHWQLCIADDASTNPEVLSILEEYAELDGRIQVSYRTRNGHICAASNTALELAKGEFVALVDHDDVIAPEALLRMVEALQKNRQAGLIYSDEDKLNEVGERFDPHFKSQWNPDMLLAQNYISHLGVYRTKLVIKVGGFREGFEGSQDHDLVLRISAELNPGQIVHVPHVLYHWRAAEGSTALESRSKSYTTDAGVAAVREHLQQRVPGIEVEPGQYPNTYKVCWPLPDKAPMVSLMIPTRDRVEMLKPCVDAILERTDYPEFEVLILDNQSTCAQTLQYMRDISHRDGRVRILRWNEAFNYSAINNFGALYAQGEILGLVNNDIEPINNDWLTEMVRQVCRPEIGCVGAKLYYPNDTIQHGGVILGIGGVAGHAHKYFDRNSPGYFTRLHLTQNLSAVTGACMLVRKSVYEEVGGLNEKYLAIAFNDVDLCLKVRAAGYRNLWTPYAELYHHESVSRGSDNSAAKRARANYEADYMRDVWGQELMNDPYYNPNLTLVHEDFSLR